VTPQSHFAVCAAITPGRMESLKALLASMNRRVGVADPENALVPFGRLDRLHFARFVVLDDRTLEDMAVYRLPIPAFPTSLAFVGDCDGPADSFLEDLSREAADGLLRIFSHCQDGPTTARGVLEWMRAHDRPAAATYVNWHGRTVRQIREEQALHEALLAHLDANGAALSRDGAATLRDTLVTFVRREQQAGRLTLTPPETTPIAWRLRNLLHAVGVPLILLLLAPLLLLYLPVYALQLRRRERADPEIAPRPPADLARRLADLEDHDVSNQFSAMGTLKPGRFRRWTTMFFLWIVDYGARHVYARGRLARVNTIHFARWIFLDGKQRMLFLSNYDGSLDSYMDDFINKVAFGLNLVFSNGIGYPRTRWLVLDGAKDEQKFKHFIRRHELPTEVWYNAHPGLTAVDLERNSRIRDGIERASMTEDEACQWLQLL
jgi:hypothetical protein